MTADGPGVVVDASARPKSAVRADAAASADLDARVLEFQEQVNLILARAKVLWREAAAQVHADLPPAAYKLLTFIASAGSANAHQLAVRFEMDKSVVSRQVRTLEELELIESRADEHDGRLRVLTATSAAHAALAEVRSRHAVRLRDALAELTQDELDTAGKVLRLLAER